MDNNTTLNFLSFNNPPSDSNFESNFSENVRNGNQSKNIGFNSPNDNTGKNLTYLDSIQSYFNIDTNMFLNRLYYSFFPFKKTNFIIDVIENNPDIYGPLWILLTLVLCIGVTNSLVHFFNTYGEQSSDVDFGMVTAAFTLLSMYISLVPLGLYFYMYYNKAATNYTYIEVLCTYGYNLTILVPISMLYHLNFSFWRISLVFVAVIITFTVLYNTFWPALRNLEKRNEAFLIMILILILQFVVITLLKVYYLDTLSPIKISNDGASVVIPHTQGSSLVKGVNSNENILVKNVHDLNVETTTISKIVNTTVKLVSDTTTAILNKNLTTPVGSSTTIKSIIESSTKSITSSPGVNVSSIISNATRN